MPGPFRRDGYASEEKTVRPEFGQAKGAEGHAGIQAGEVEVIRPEDDRKRAVAIVLSEAREAGAKVLHEG
jgi:Family of unknown function (DUF6496)